MLTVIAEDGNRHDRFAVALSVPEIGVVGHVRTSRVFLRGETLSQSWRDTDLQGLWEETIRQRIGSAMYLLLPRQKEAGEASP